MYFTVLHCTALLCIALHGTLLHFTVLHCNVLPSAPQTTMQCVCDLLDAMLLLLYHRVATCTSYITDPRPSWSPSCACLQGWILSSVLLLYHKSLAILNTIMCMSGKVDVKLTATCSSTVRNLQPSWSPSCVRLQRWMVSLQPSIATE